MAEHFTSNFAVRTRLHPPGRTRCTHCLQIHRIEHESTRTRTLYSHVRVLGECIYKFGQCKCLRCERGVEHSHWTRAPAAPQNSSDFPILSIGIYALTRLVFPFFFVLDLFTIQVYPGRDITNIVESSHYQKIGGWCRQGSVNAAKCKGAQRWIKPFRCLGECAASLRSIAA